MDRWKGGREGRKMEVKGRERKKEGGVRPGCCLYEHGIRQRIEWLVVECVCIEEIREIVEVKIVTIHCTEIGGATASPATEGSGHPHIRVTAV